MSHQIPPGKTILQLSDHIGPLDQSNSYIEVHVDGEESSQRLPLNKVIVPGKSVYDLAIDNGFNGTEEEFLNSLKAKDLFELAQQNGFTGSLSEFIESMKGEVGNIGPEGPEGPQGPEGKSAYEVAVETGYIGNKFQWIESLKGPKGDQGTPGDHGRSLRFLGDFTNSSLPEGLNGDVATLNGIMTIHDGNEWITVGVVGTQGEQGEQGPAGKSFFEDLVESGIFSGTKEEFVESLKGEQGEQGIQGIQGVPGKSVLELAIEEELLSEGSTVTDLMESLKGDRGPEGPQGPMGPPAEIPKGLGHIGIAWHLPPTTSNEEGSTEDLSRPWDLMINPSTMEVTQKRPQTGDLSEQWIPLGSIKGIDEATIRFGTENPNEHTKADFYLNTTSKELFRYDSAESQFVSFAILTGGEAGIPVPALKEGFQAIENGQWKDIPLVNDLPSMENDVQYVIKNRNWKRFDNYTLAVHIPEESNDYELDFSQYQVFRITNGGPTRIHINKIPPADRAATYVIKIYGNTGPVQWSMPDTYSAVRWFEESAPVLTEDVTTVILTWDGLEMTGHVPN